MFYDYTPESNDWTLPYNSLPKKDFETINGAFLDVESSATVRLDSFGKTSPFIRLFICLQDRLNTIKYH